MDHGVLRNGNIKLWKLAYCRQVQMGNYLCRLPVPAP